MTRATTPRVRNFGVGKKRRHRAGSHARGSTDGGGVAGRVGVAVVMYSPQWFGLLGERRWALAADLVTSGEQRVIAVAPLFLLVQ